MNPRFADSMLPAVLGALLPGNSEWPPASDTHVAAFAARRASEAPDLARALAAVCDVLPADFADRDFAARTSALRAAESRRAHRGCAKS